MDKQETEKGTGMTESRRRILAVLMSVVLAFSMTSATAVQAFAQALTIGTANDPSGSVVYDDVYGVLGGQYALMTKTVVADHVYGTVYDVVRADGTVVVHSSTESKDNRVLPGDYAECRLFSVGGYANDIIAGYVGLKNKQTQNCGIWSLENGTWAIPCDYTQLQMDNEINWFVCAGFQGSNVIVSFFTPDFQKACDDIVIPFERQANEASKCTASMWGPYLEITARSGDNRLTAFAKQANNSFEVISGYKEILGSDGNGNLLVVKDDDAPYIVTIDGTETKVNYNGNIEDIWFDHGFICIDDGFGNCSYCSVVTGDLLDFGGGDFSSARDGYAVFSFENDDGPDTYAIFNQAGECVVNQFVATQVIIVNANCYLKIANVDSDDGTDEEMPQYVVSAHDMNGTALFGPLYFDEWPSTEVIRNGNDFYLTVSIYYPNEDELDANGNAVRKYALMVYDSKGALVKDFGISDNRKDIYGVYENEWRPEGERTLLGFEVYTSTDDDDDEWQYFDTNFNELDERPQANSSSVEPDNLMFGAKRVVIKQAWDSVSKSFYKQVTDANGNAISVNGYTLGISSKGMSDFAVWNFVKHGNADIWWATDASGVWGAIDSNGNVVVPFEYESYCDAGYGGTDYALVMKDGNWYFFNVATGTLGAQVKNLKQNENAANISNATITVASATYTGKPLKPAVTVSMNKVRLVEKIDYTLLYSNNTKAGTGKVTVTGKGNYSGKAVKTFTINKASATKFTVANATCTGNPVKPVVKLGNVIMEEGVDYTISFKNVAGKTIAASKVVAAGTYKAVLKGIGSCTGTTAKTFKLVKAKNPLTVIARNPTVLLTKVKKKAQVIPAKKAYTITKAQGKLTYKKASSVRNIEVNKKTGDLVVAKGTKKGVYNVKVEVKAAGNKCFKAGIKTVTVKVTVK